MSNPTLLLSPFLSQLTIQTKELTTEAFNLAGDFAWAQRRFLGEIENQYNAGKPVRIIVLKARQLGISTATEGVLFWWAFIHPGTNGLVIAHENDASQSLFEKTKLYWETWPYREMFVAKYATQKRLTWEPTRSTLRVATAKNIQSGRGRTLHAVHASECAFYPEPEALMLGLSQTIPNRHGSIVVLESTANGVGNWFHETWLAAEEGESDYVPLFFPWWKHYEYAQPTHLNIRSELSPEERQLLKLGATYEHLQWRRWAIPNLAGNDIEYFMQEYPATPTEAFITTGTNVFPLRQVDECYHPEAGFRGMLIDRGDKRPKFVAEATGRLTIFKRPAEHGERRQDRYFVSGDPSMTLAGDPACIQVINRQTLEQVAVWHGRIDPINFAKEMMLIGYYYHSAEICPEIEGGGYAAIGVMLESNYPSIWQHRWADKAPGKVSISYGWQTNYQRKHWAIGRLKYIVGDSSLKLHDQKTYNQLRNYVVLSSGEMGNADPKIHDDAVMALAIGVCASETEGPFAIDRRPTNILDLFGDDYTNAVV